MLNFKLKFVFIVLSLFLFDCNTEEQSSRIPKNILSIDEFSNVLVDFALAESASNLNIKNVASNKVDSVYTFNPLKDNNIRKTQFDSSLEFYCHHGTLYAKAYEQVLTKLTEMEALKKLKTDSIKLK